MVGQTPGVVRDTGASVAEDRLKQRMATMGVREQDLVETFVRSSGPGGQNVNKTSTAVILRHAPSGIQVRCEAERSQGRNRVKARELLLDRLDEARRRSLADEKARAELARRQRRRRPKSLQESILRTKARQSQKKRLRRGPAED